MKILSNYRIPITIYGILILVILISKKLLGFNYVISLAATFMLLVPIFLNEDDGLFKFNYKGFRYALIWTVLILIIYMILAYLFLKVIGKQFEFRPLNFYIVFIHLFLIAIPEEIFFRGYLQVKFGNTLLSIVIVSLLFAMAHFVTICVFGSHGIFTCAQNILTFFPSLVMGYLYYKTGTIWSSVLFHFLANIIHVSIVLN